MQPERRAEGRGPRGGREPGDPELRRIQPGDAGSGLVERQMQADVARHRGPDAQRRRQRHVEGAPLPDVGLRARRGRIDGDPDDRDRAVRDGDHAGGAEVEMGQAERRLRRRDRPATAGRRHLNGANGAGEVQLPRPGDDAIGDRDVLERRAGHSRDFVVELVGLEPTTSWVRSRRSSS